MEQIIEIKNAEAFRKYTDPETFNKISEFETVSQMWEKCIENYGDLTAIEDDKNSYTFNEIEKKASSLRFAINKILPNNQNRIALLAENSVSFAIAFLAIATSGNAALIFPLTLNEQAIAECCKKYNIKLLLHTEIMQDKVKIANSFIPVLNIKNALSNELSPIQNCDGNDECVLMFTSGTTGQNKAAILNNRAVMQSTVDGCYAYKDVFNQRYLLVLPLYHIFGFTKNFMTSLYTGSHLFICQNQQDMFKDIEKFKPTIFSAVPAVIEIGLKLSKLFNRNMFGESMETICAGAATIPPYLIKECAKYNINLCPGYGLTEETGLVSGNPESALKPESVGIPFPNQELKIVNGELWVKGKNRMDGYADKDAENPFEGEWLKTGDLARFDEDGFLYITGRCKEIIVLSNGENISPAEIEAQFNRLPYVQDSQVYEDINENKEHILALEVVTRETAFGSMPKEDRAKFLRKQLDDINNSLPSDRRMNKIIIRNSDFERSASMKIIRYKKV